MTAPTLAPVTTRCVSLDPALYAPCPLCDETIDRCECDLDDVIAAREAQWTAEKSA
jgi:hypothetical protein